MKKILFTTLPSNDLGLLTRSLPVASELAKRGHTIAFCSPGNTPNKLIREAGFSNIIPRHPLYYLIASEPNLSSLYGAIRSGQRDFGIFNFWSRLVRSIPTKKATSTAEVWNLDHFWALLGMMSENFVRANCGIMKNVMKEFEPDIVVDSWNPFASIVAKATKKPLVTIIQADTHPDSQGFIWWKETPPNVPTCIPVVNKVLSSYGLQPIVKIEDLSVGDLTLVLGTAETDPLPEKANITYIGPLIWQKPGDMLPDWISALSKEKSIIWVYTGNPRYMRDGSWANSDVVLHACIEALTDKDIQVVLTTGYHSLPKGTVPLPPNFQHEPYVPGLAMAERSDLLIHHGGYGSCQTGLFTGTPAIIIPTMAERESNARKIASCGAGDFVIPSTNGSGKNKQVNTTELRSKVNHILSDHSYTINAKRISEKMRACGGAPEAASLIEAFTCN